MHTQQKEQRDSMYIQQKKQRKYLERLLFAYQTSKSLEERAKYAAKAKEVALALQLKMRGEK